MALGSEERNLMPLSAGVAPFALPSHVAFPVPQPSRRQAGGEQVKEPVRGARVEAGGDGDAETCVGRGRGRWGAHAARAAT